MDKEFRKYLHNNEGIIIRKGGLKDFVIRRISSDNDNGSYDLIKLVKNPCVVNAKRMGILFKIGVVSMESIHSNIPINYATRLFVEYDNEGCDKKLINKFYNKFKDYSFILYTSWNHSMQRPRFRAIVTVKNPINRLCLKNREYINYLGDVFTLDKEKPDTSCFQDYQCQLLPLISEKKKPLYKYIINKGKKLELKEYSEVTGSKEVIPEFDVTYGIDEIIKANLYTNLELLDTEKIKSKQAEFEKYLDKIKKNNFNKTKEYKEAKEKLNMINVREKPNEVFANKHKFLTKRLPKYVGRRNLEGFYKEWETLYKFDIRDNDKWRKKFEEFLPKAAKYCNVDLEDLK